MRDLYWLFDDGVNILFRRKYGIFGEDFLSLSQIHFTLLLQKKPISYNSSWTIQIFMFVSIKVDKITLFLHDGIEFFRIFYRCYIFLDDLSSDFNTNLLIKFALYAWESFKAKLYTLSSKHTWIFGFRSLLEVSRMYFHEIRSCCVIFIYRNIFNILEF